MAKTYSAGIATAYGAAKRGGYTGTYEDFCREQAGFAGNAQQVAEDRAAVEVLAVQFENTTVPQAIIAVQQEAATQVGNVNTAGSAQVQRVQEEGTAQVGRVQIAVTEQMDRAELAANNALTSERNAADSASAASESEANAEASKIAAAQSAAQAQETVDGALSAINTAKEEALTAVESAEDDAVQAVQTEGATQTARAKAQADAAALSATNAADSASTASTKAGEAADSAAAAAGSASDAEADKDAAEAAQAAAEAAAQSVSESAAQIAQNTTDIAELQTDVDDIKINEYKSYATDTASGAVAAFSDGADNIPVKSLVVDIEPVQAGSGDPSPDNIRPISGWTEANVTRAGKNLNPYEGVNYTADTYPDGFWLNAGDYVFSLDTGGAFGTGNSIYIKLKDRNGNVITDGNVDGVVWALNSTRQYYYGFGGNFTAAPFTLLTDCFFCFGFNNTKPTANGIQLELGSTATAYEPYAGEIYSISFPSEAGTVYGGTLDVTTGKLTVTHWGFDMGSVNYTQSATLASRFAAFFPTGKEIANLEEQSRPSGNIISSKYKEGSYTSVWSNGQTGICVYLAGNIMKFGICDPSYTDVEAFKQSITGQTVVYKLATPIVYTLTPTEVTTLLAQNNIWANCGVCTVNYRADTKLYIDKKIAALAAAMN